MALASGTRLGPYEIQSALGAGGMGEVYRARDTKLARDVALKVVSETFTHDPDRMARFRREAQLLAALNHPHIATIHGIEESDGTQFLVMELVDGETLAARLGAGPLPLAEALTIARQVAEALQAAHDKGIIHRDLKPANIALTAAGQVKVLDFGLAKALESAGSAVDSPAAVTHSPTLSLAATQAGVILGTAAYMAPEQARGKPADKRADIWAFGCVLFEMLTGRRAFEGEDATITLAAALMRDPDWTLLPAWTPPAIRSLLRRCLEKDRGRRLGDIAAALFVLDDTALAAPVEAGLQVRRDAPAAVVEAGFTRSAWHRTAIVAAATACATGAIVGTAAWWLTRPDPAPVVRTEITTAGATALSVLGIDRNIAITPDGSRIVFRGNNSLLVRAFDQLEPQVLTGLGAPRGPFVSPDGQWIGFFDGLTMKKVAITGGPPVTIAKSLDGGARGATWGPDGAIVFATLASGTGLFRVPAAGGDPVGVTKPNRESGEGDHVWPEFLPDGRTVLFTILASGSLDNAQVAVLDLATGTYRVVVRGGHHAHYVPTGHLVYGAGGSLRAVPFNLARREVTGTPVPVLEGVLTSGTGAVDAVVANGTLVYLSGGVGMIGAARSLVWVTREGREDPVPAPPRGYFALRLSPDGVRAAIDIRDQENDVWVWDFARQTLTRLTFAAENDIFPVWSPDGRHIVFQRGALFSRAADGTGAEEQLTTDTGALAMSFAPDGRQLVVTLQNDIGLVALDGKGRMTPLVRTMFAEGNADLSPDGRWLAYQSNESGQDQIYVQPFPDLSGGRWQVSPAGGTKPAWARNGRELFFLDGTGALVAVAIQTQPAFSPGNPTKLFDAPYFSVANTRSYDITPDGRRFLFIKNAAETSGPSAAPTLVVVQHWLEELKRLVPVQ